MRWWLASESPVRCDDRRSSGVAAGEDTGRQKADKRVKETTLNYSATKGIQNPSEYETPARAKVKDFLELSTVAGKFEQA
jgi:hypothetical protein